MKNHKAFTYVPNVNEFRAEENAVMAFIPPNISNRLELFTLLKEQLKFPYFGDNWDSLDELLGDLSWLKSRQVVIVHKDLPILNEKDLRIYLETLLDNAQAWQPNEDHELVIVFPATSKERVDRILS